jgi:mono/diheme cytochrome c family protein
VLVVWPTVSKATQPVFYPQTIIAPVDYKTYLLQLAQQRQQLQQYAQLQAAENLSFQQTLQSFGYLMAPQGNTIYGYQTTDLESRIAALEKAAAKKDITQRASTIQELFTSKCVECHNPNKKSGGVDLSDSSALSEQLKERIQNSVVNPDPSKRMPRNGDALTFPEILLLK